MTSVETLPTPAFVVDLAKVKRNCAKMLSTASENNVNLRAQIKTHKTVEGAVLQTGGTKRGVVTSTFAESFMLAEAGFDDILFGYPLSESHMTRNFELRRKLEAYHVFVHNTEAVEVLLKCAPPKNKRWSVFIKVNCGDARAGIWHESDLIIDVAELLRKNQEVIEFQGLYVHCGNSYTSKTVPDVHNIRDTSIARLVNVKKRIEGEVGLNVANIGTGSTPSCSHSNRTMADLTEIHPGAYVFYDAQQTLLGSCSSDDIAGCVMTRVLAHFPDKNRLLVDCGFTALTKQGFEAMNGTFAWIKGHPDLLLADMTQELGKIESKKPIRFEDFPIGSVLYLYPYHCCATASVHPKYFVHENGILKDEWIPCKGW